MLGFDITFEKIYYDFNGFKALHSMILMGLNIFSVLCL